MAADVGDWPHDSGVKRQRCVAVLCGREFDGKWVYDLSGVCRHAPHTNGTLVNPLRRLAPLATVVVLGLLVPRTVSAGLIMRIDTDSKTFFIEGSDAGNADYSRPDPFLPGDYSLQFIHYFSTTVPQFGIITESAANLFAEGATLPMYGHMYMVSNSGQNYVFMDLFSGGGDITSLTGTGPSAALSYAGLAASDIPLFESLIGDALVLSSGTGYSPISVQGVQAVPEIDPTGMGSVLALIGGGLGLLERRRKRS